MMKKIYLISGIALFFLFGIGCSEGESPIADIPVSNQGILTDLTVHMLTPEAFTDQGLSKSERSDIAKNSHADYVLMAQIMQHSPSWEVAHEKMQAYLATPSESPDYLREQRAAVFMLKAARGMDNLSVSDKEALVGYIDLLAKHKSPEAAVTLQALQQVEGYLSEEKVRFVAERAVEGANTYLDSNYYCDNCPASKANKADNKIMAETQDAFIAELFSSIEILNRMAGL